MGETAWARRCVQCANWTLTKYTRCDHCRTLMQRYGKMFRGRLRTEVYQAYGNKCACCGESETMFLTLDHVNGDGAAHRRELGECPSGGAGARVYMWAKKNNYPPRLQLLCFNCNCGRARNNGVCPHNNTREGK